MALGSVVGKLLDIAEALVKGMRIDGWRREVGREHSAHLADLFPNGDPPLERGGRAVEFLSHGFIVHFHRQRSGLLYKPFKTAEDFGGFRRPHGDRRSQFVKLVGHACGPALRRRMFLQLLQLREQIRRRFPCPTNGLHRPDGLHRRLFRRRGRRGCGKRSFGDRLRFGDRLFSATGWREDRGRAGSKGRNLRSAYGRGGWGQGI